ncbi:hypothetical protein CDEST_02210 [Colletotrichum destructivum]|uniref:Uncharacterized protein n=1 Tax=Colletotrichum destructivum TaxID=34406 RepID=A0AAX4I1F8_9PEZI|nr:hypothetical protein CDEST_02210 [Colletotrichum destructivum]
MMDQPGYEDESIVIPCLDLPPNSIPRPTPPLARLFQSLPHLVTLSVSRPASCRNLNRSLESKLFPSHPPPPWCSLQVLAQSVPSPGCVWLLRLQSLAWHLLLWLWLRLRLRLWVCLAHVPSQTVLQSTHRTAVCECERERAPSPSLCLSHSHSHSRPPCAPHQHRALPLHLPHTRPPRSWRYHQSTRAHPPLSLPRPLLPPRAFLAPAYIHTLPTFRPGRPPILSLSSCISYTSLSLFSIHLLSVPTEKPPRRPVLPN